MNFTRVQYPVPQNGLGQMQISPTTPVGRQNLAKLTTGVALAGGAAWAFLAMPSASKKTKTALGVLGGGLAATALLSAVDAFL